MDTPLLIHPIRAFRDNYIWTIHNQHYALVVDPGDAQPVLDYLEQNKLDLCAILITHHHSDHVGGVSVLHQHAPVPVFGPAHERIPCMDHPLIEGDTVNISELNLMLQVLDIPGHTLGHIAYIGPEMLFCGDTLFGCGCGRLFEGTPTQMLNSLQKLARLPATTQVFCAHEYTLDNIAFALTIEPDNLALRARAQHDSARIALHQPTLPSSLEIELATNPFLRLHAPSILHQLTQHTGHAISQPIDAFIPLRQMKNNFHA